MFAAKEASTPHTFSIVLTDHEAIHLSALFAIGLGAVIGRPDVETIVAEAMLIRCDAETVKALHKKVMTLHGARVVGRQPVNK